jgi:hypothetical protein
MVKLTNKEENNFQINEFCESFLKYFKEFNII